MGHCHLTKSSRKQLTKQSYKKYPWIHGPLDIVNNTQVKKNFNVHRRKTVDSSFAASEVRIMFTLWCLLTSAS